MSDKETANLPSTTRAAEPPQSSAPMPLENRADSISASNEEDQELPKDVSDLAPEDNDEDATKASENERERASVREYHHSMENYHHLALARMCMSSPTESETPRPTVAAPSARPVVGNYPNPPAAQSVPSSRMQGLLLGLSRLTIEPEPTEAPEATSRPRLDIPFPRPHWWIDEEELARVSPYVAEYTRHMQAAQLEAERLGMDTWDYIQLSRRNQHPSDSS